MRNFTIAVALSSFLLLPFTAFAVVEISDGSVKMLFHLEDTVDSSGNGYNLSTYGSVSNVSAKFGNGYLFSGGGCLFNGHTAFSGNSNFTIHGWYKATSNSNKGNFIAAGESGQSGTTLTQGNTNSSTNGDNLLIGNQPIAWRDTGTDFVDTNWHMFDLVNRGGTQFIYKDASISPNNNTDAPTMTQASTTIGCSYDHTSAPYFFENANGTVDEVALINSPLSTSTIETLYNSGTGNEICTTVGCGSSSSSTATSSFIFMSTTTDQNVNNTFILFQYLILSGVFILVAYGVYKFFKR